MSKSEKAIFASEIHRRAVKKFRRRKVIVHRINEIWALDLASLESLSSYNDGYKYMLCVIDVFSKYAWAIPLKNKTAASVLAAVQSIVKKSKRIPEKIWVDQGSEFYNKSFKDWLKSNEITMYSTYGDSKSVVVERFIRTLKDIATKYFTEHSTRDWVNNLETFLHEYNNRKHKTIKMTPAEASKPANEEKVREIFVNETIRNAPRLLKGDKVRINRIKGTFEKGYENNWSYEVFTVTDILPTNPTTYKIKDYFDEPIEGSFYDQELLKTEVEDYYEIEKILKTRKVGKKKEHLVKFVGWPEKFNEWISDDQIYDLKK